MERIKPDKLRLLPTYQWRIYKASSIADMVNSREKVEAKMRAEHSRWVEGLDFRERLEHAKNLLILLWGFPDTFTHLVLSKIPSIEAVPRALVFLPKIQHYPVEDEGLKGGQIRLSDVTGSVNVGFPYGDTDSIGRDLGLNVDRQVAREISWSGPVVLFNVYGPWPRSFLMHIYNIKATEKAEERVRQLVPRLAFDPQGA